ncbi:hypothetical protein LSM04_002911 [Trypanosoma melophagium]|uniref:uncharacterized protein n=1 Tax=Trypanosoma melophagium TaxID=715481 RepID=UPI00351A6607|nr:hypothetical protein LSM04_002911 [Trypanosoma melophagium]
MRAAAHNNARPSRANRPTPILILRGGQGLFRLGFLAPPLRWAGVRPRPRSCAPKRRFPRVAMLLTHVSAHRGGSDAPFVNGPDLSYSSAARRPKTDRACTRATAHRGIGAKTQSFLSREYLRQRNPLCRAVGREREPASAGAPQGVRRREKPTATAIREQAEAPRISLRSYILALSLRRRLRLKALRSDIPRKRRQNHRLQAHNPTASGSPAPIPTSILWNGVRDASFDVDTFKGAWGFQAQGQGTPWRWCIARLSEKAPRGDPTFALSHGAPHASRAAACA